MATTLSTSLKTSVNWTYTDTTNALANTTNSGSVSYSKTLSDGANAGQANRMYMATGTIAGAGTLSIDLAASLANVFGSTITFARVKGFYFNLTSDTTSTSVTLGGAGSNPAILWFGNVNDTESVRNDGVSVHWCTDATAWAVTAATADILLITNADATNTATYKLFIVGCAT
jgi:hypothetical protein